MASPSEIGKCGFIAFKNINQMNIVNCELTGNESLQVHSYSPAISKFVKVMKEKNLTGKEKDFSIKLNYEIKSKINEDEASLCGVISARVEEIFEKKHIKIEGKKYIKIEGKGIQNSNKTSDQNQYFTDLSIGNDDHPMMINFEFKKANGKDGVSQNFAYYMKEWERVHSKAIQNQNQKGIQSHFPSLLVTVTDTVIHIHGAVCDGQRFIFNELFCFSLISSERPSLVLWHCLKDSVEDLLDEMTQNQNYLSNYQLHFPLFREFQLNSQSLKYEYLKELKPNTYLAQDMTTKNQVIIKLCYYNYSIKVHQFLSKKGYAPKMIHNERKEEINLTIVIMDYIKDASSWNSSKATKKHKDKLVMCVKELHENNMVHGDIREPNVLMKGDEDVYLIDFEFSGEVGQATYSKHLNPSINWHSGVLSGGTVEKDHDTHMLQKLVDLVK